MGLLDFFRKDISDDWPVTQPGRLTLDMKAPAVNGVVPGDDANDLRIFGRPANRRAFSRGFFVFAEWGFCVHSEAGRVIDFRLVLLPESDDAAGVRKPCDLEIHFPDGSRFPVRSTTPAGELVSRLGEPVEKDADEHGTDYVYAVDDSRVEFDYNPAGELTDLYLWAED
jgi:hypothetical protein